MDTFKKFGRNFQVKLVALLMTNMDFLEQIYGILEEEFFESEAIQVIVKIIKDYYSEYRKLITLDVLALELKKQTTSILRTLAGEAVKEIYGNINLTDGEYISDSALQFCKNQKLKAAIMASIEHLKAGDYDSIKNEVDLALRAGISPQLGHDYELDFEMRYDKELRKCVTLPWPVLTDLSDGGLGRGELGIVVGGAGSGKSWLLAAIGAHAIEQGKNVLHYTLELNSRYVGLRYDSILTGYDFRSLTYHKEDIREKLNERNLGKLKIKYFPPLSVNSSGIFAHAKRAETFGYKPDLIIIDYGDNVQPKTRTRGQESSYFVMGQVYTELRGLAGELDVPI